MNQVLLVNELEERTGKSLSLRDLETLDSDAKFDTRVEYDLGGRLESYGISATAIREYLQRAGGDVWRIIIAPSVNWEARLA